VSYHFNVPAGAGHVTAESFQAEAEALAAGYLACWPDDEQKAATEAATARAIAAAVALARTGIVGPTFAAQIYGHANPEPGPADVYRSPDSCTISLLAIRPDAAA
jgi:hypothetical protein